MRTLFAFLAAIAAPLAVASTTVVETNGGEPCPGCDRKVAQVCISSPELVSTVGVSTRWNVGDASHQVLYGYQGQMIYRLVPWQNMGIPSFEAGIFVAGGTPAEMQKLDFAWTDENAHDCSQLPEYELRILFLGTKNEIRLVKKIKP